MHCNVPIEGVVHLPTVDNCLYHPLVMEDMGVGEFVCKTLGVEERPANFDDWRRVVEVDTEDYDELTIAIVANTSNNPTPTYPSLSPSSTPPRPTNANSTSGGLMHHDQSRQCRANPQGRQRYSRPGRLRSPWNRRYDHDRELAVENRVPYLGLCLGMQVMVIEFARNVLGITDADSVECDSSTTEPIIDIMPEQAKIDNLGGTMRSAFGNASSLRAQSPTAPTTRIKSASDIATVTKLTPSTSIASSRAVCGYPEYRSG